MNDEQCNSIKTLTRVYYDYQRERMALDGRLGLTKDGEKKKRAPEKDMVMLAVLTERRKDVMAFEEVTLHGKKNPDGAWNRDASLYEIVHHHLLWKAYLSQVKGVGEAMAAVIISEFDIEKATTVSKMWQFAGMNPGEVYGKLRKKGELVTTTTKIRGDKRTKGFLCPYNQFLKSKLLGVLGPSFIKCNSPYRDFYDNMKHRYESMDWGTASKNPTDKSRPKAGHQHNAALRYMVKRFLVDLYIAWRTLEGLEVRPPYQEEYLGKVHQVVA